MRIALLLIMVFYALALGALFYMMHRGPTGYDSFSEYLRGSVNLVPFKTIAGFIEGAVTGTMDADFSLTNLLGNLVAFMPMGLFLPCVFKKTRRFTGLLLCSSLVVLFIEGLQLITMHGSFDIDDFILNISGALLGYAFWRLKPIQAVYRYIFEPVKVNN